MRILRYASDLHLELRTGILHPKLTSYWDFKRSDKDKYYLALLGDVGNPYQCNLNLFMQKVAPVYDKIFYIPGNHEYYNFNVNPNRCKIEFDTALETLCGSFDNVILLNNKTHQLDDIKIIGSTLWTKIPEDHRAYLSNAINDYHLIKKMDGENLVPINIDDTNSWNDESVEFIRTEIDNATTPCIVMTHHAPLFSDEITKRYTADPVYLNGKNNFAFHNNLMEMIKKPVTAWLYGHTHYAGSFKINDVLVATNQLGYQREESKISFSQYAYVDLDKLVK